MTDNNPLAEELSQKALSQISVVTSQPDRTILKLAGSNPLPGKTLVNVNRNAKQDFLVPPEVAQHAQERGLPQRIPGQSLAAIQTLYLIETGNLPEDNREDLEQFRDNTIENNRRES